MTACLAAAGRPSAAGLLRLTEWRRLPSCQRETHCVVFCCTQPPSCRNSLLHLRLRLHALCQPPHLRQNLLLHCREGEAGLGDCWLQPAGHGKHQQQPLLATSCTPVLIATQASGSGTTAERQQKQHSAPPTSVPLSFFLFMAATSAPAARLALPLMAGSARPTRGPGPHATPVAMHFACTAAAPAAAGAAAGSGLVSGSATVSSCESSVIAAKPLLACTSGQGDSGPLERGLCCSRACSSPPRP